MIGADVRSSDSEPVSTAVWEKIMPLYVFDCVCVVARSKSANPPSPGANDQQHDWNS